MKRTGQEMATQQVAAVPNLGVLWKLRKGLASVGEFGGGGWVWALLQLS